MSANRLRDWTKDPDPLADFHEADAALARLLERTDKRISRLSRLIRRFLGRSA